MSKDLIFNVQLCEQLDLLGKFDLEIVSELSEMCLRLLDSGKNPSSRLMTKAASKLNVEVESLELCLQALTQLFFALTKQLKGKKRALNSLEMLGVPHGEFLARFWDERVRQLISMQSCFVEMHHLNVNFQLEAKLDLKEDYFDGILKVSWTLDALIQTRANLVKKSEPVLTVTLQTKHEGDIQFEANPNLIRQLTSDLEKSLQTMKGPDARKLQRYF